MTHVVKILLLPLFLLSLAEVGVCQTFHVVEKTFCLKIKDSNCIRPAKAAQVTLSSIEEDEHGNARLYFWCSLEVPEKKNILHIWTASDRSDEWDERIHVAKSDSFEESPEVDDLMLAASEILNHAYSKAISYIRNKMKALLMGNVPSAMLHSLQGILLDVKKSPLFRTYSSIRAVPGTYRVEIRGLDDEIVPGGEEMTIRIVTEVESNR